MTDQVPQVTVRRAFQVYLYAVCFVTILIVLFTAAESVYSLVRIAAPGTTGYGGLQAIERHAGTAALIRDLIFGAFALGVFMFHWNHARAVRSDLDRALNAPPPEA
jgi:hypothetical protein